MMALVLFFLIIAWFIGGLLLFVHVVGEAKIETKNSFLRSLPVALVCGPFATAALIFYVGNRFWENHVPDLIRLIGGRLTNWIDKD